MPNDINHLLIRYNFKLKIIKMRNTIYDQNIPSLQIDQNEVNKFYRERQLIKNKMTNTFNTKKDENEVQPPFINLFRRKSLANKLKQQSGFSNLEDSLEINKPMVPDVSMNENTLSKLNLSLQSLDETLKDRFGQSFTKKFNYFQVPQQTSQTYENQYVTPEPTERQIKKRSNSVQIQNSSCSLRYQSRKSLQNLKPLKQTVPLSSILRKYQQEVSKIQHEGVNLDEDRNIFRKTQKDAIFKDVKNTQNFNDFQLHQKTVKQDKISVGQQNQSQNFHIKLPQVVQQCIDKWKKLQIQQIKAEMRHSKENFESDHKLEKDSSKKNEKDLVEKITLQYEQRLKQQQEKIQLLEKQNCQFRKFALSIQKMKNTLERIQHQDIKIRRGADIVEAQHQQKKINKKDCQAEIQQDLNLKQLWRWIKTLPGSKSSQKQKKSSFRC